MLNGPFKSFDSIEEDGLQVFQSRIIPYPMNSDRDFFNRLKCLILAFLLQQSK
jgi:hypothetical protein